MIFIINKKMPRKSRNTRQKEIISIEISKINDFFTAEELYARTRKHEIGLATIYRYLKELKKLDMIHSYTCDNKLLYSKDKRSHCHFICEETGKIIHFEVDSLDFLQKKIPGTITSFQIEVKGKCLDCKKR
jgi:Fe2+ or Zn2+ uptake regulation protein